MTAAPTRTEASSTDNSSVLPPLASDQPRRAHHGTTVAGGPPAAAQRRTSTHRPSGGGTFAAPTKVDPAPTVAASVLPPLSSSMAPASGQDGHGDDTFAAPTRNESHSISVASVLPPLAAVHGTSDPHSGTGGGDPPAVPQGTSVTQAGCGDGTLAAPTIAGAPPKKVPSVLPSSAAAHSASASQPALGGGNSSNQPPIDLASPNENAGGWLELRIWAEMFHDAQKTRIAAHNRAERGGVSADIYAGYTEATESAEHVCKLALARTYRRVVPGQIVAWQKNERGIGEPLLARLLGHLGDPYIATPYRWMAEAPEGHECGGTCGADRHLVALEPFARTVGQLWAYCGVGDPTRKRRRLMDADEALAAGKPLLKSLVYLLAVACVKQPAGCTYRDAYDAGRERYAERIHVEACPPCHAKPEQPWKPGHQHAAALRLVGKEILRDLWLAAREAHS